MNVQIKEKSWKEGDEILKVEKFTYWLPENLPLGEL
jgi:hypothetical protein